MNIIRHDRLAVRCVGGRSTGVVGAALARRVREEGAGRGVVHGVVPLRRRVRVLRRDSMERGGCGLCAGRRGLSRGGPLRAEGRWWGLLLLLLLLLLGGGGGGGVGGALALALAAVRAALDALLAFLALAVDAGVCDAVLDAALARAGLVAALAGGGAVRALGVCERYRVQ